MSATSLWMAWLHGLVAGGIVLLVARWLTACLGEPARQHRVAWWASFSALAAPFVCMLPGWWTLPLPQFDPFATAAVVPQALNEVGELEDAGIDLTQVELVPMELAGVPPVGAEPALPFAKAERRWGWQEILVGAVLTHVCFVLLWASRLMAGAWRLSVWWRRAKAPPAPLQTIFESLALEMQVPRAKLRLSALCGAPLCFGWWRPKVLLPLSWNEAGDRPLRWVLAHELSHLRRNDPAANWLWSLAQAFFGLWPWTWTLTRQARLCQEFLADAEAARREEQATAGAAAVEDYAAFLVRLSADCRAPVGAAAANARPSDLMRRIVMLTQRARTLETQCPRRWTLAVGAGLFGLATVLGGLQPGASAAPIKEEPKKEEKQDKKGLDRQIDDALKELEKNVPQANDPVQPDVRDPLRLQRDLREALKKMQIGANADVAKQIEEIEAIQKQMIEQMQRQIGGIQRFGGGGVIINGRPIGGFGGVARVPFGTTNRLGVRLQAPPAVVVEQMDLPEGQGLIVADVNAGSPAEKAGLKKHDILIEVGGAKVPNTVPAFQNQLKNLKDEPVDATVIRKGKRETVKGIKLAEAKDAAPGQGGGVFEIPLQIQPGGIQIQPGGNIQVIPFQPGQALPVPNIQIQPLPNGGALPNIQFPNIQNLIPPQGAAGKVQAIAGGNGTSTAISRSNDDFSIEHTNNGLKMSVQGKVENGKATPSNIVIQDGDDAVRAATVDQVPEKYRGQLERLLQGIR
jgi:beta-lactamase regulating signal transducer with metallopeptidase domain/membrane-associated protease RseP (regulator of RpoE activity)